MDIRDYLKTLKENGYGLYEAMDELDKQAERQGYHGPAFYNILGDVYADEKHPLRNIYAGEKRKHRRKFKSQLPSADWEVVKERYGNRCFYCGKESNKLNKEHVIPICRGGTDTIENIVPACWKCNRTKGKRLVAEFKEGVILKLL